MDGLGEISERRERERKKGIMMNGEKGGKKGDILSGL